MSRLGPMQFGRNQGQVFLGRDIGHERNYSDQIAYEIDQEMQRIINECYERCKELLIKHRDQLELVATTLLRVETLDAEQIKRLIETGKLEEDDTAADNSDVVVNIQPKKDEETNEEPKA
jgi:cell division protease FtsH